MSDILLRKINEVFFHVRTSRAIEYELSDHFQFKAPNFWFHPKFKARIWDGHIRLYDRRTRQIYRGLLSGIIEFAKDRKYSIDVEGVDETITFTTEDAINFYAKLNLPFTAEYFQVDALSHCISNDRALLVSATGSGKSAIIYALCRYYTELAMRILVIVPSVDLTTQLKDNFNTYAENDSNFTVNDHLHLVSAGKSKTTDKQIVCSTWQSLTRLPPAYFQSFQVVIVDECHHAKSKEIKTLLEKMSSVKYRFGTTGTLDGVDWHELTIQGLLGPTHHVSVARDLIDQQILPELRIKAIILKYPEKARKQLVGVHYRDELKYLFSHKKRTKFVCRLALQQTKNTLILVRQIEQHGKPLFEQLTTLRDELYPNRALYWVSGTTSTKSRAEIRSIVEKHSDAIIVATEGVFSTGINIPSLDVLILPYPSKARIKLIQSIGRLLRKGKRTTHVTVYDIVDDLSWKKSKNYAVKHFLERAKIYAQERHRYKIKKVSLGEQTTKHSNLNTEVEQGDHR